VEFGPLPGYLGYLLRRVQARVFVDFGESVGATFGISPGEFGLLTLIGCNPGITQVRLAAAVGLDKSTLSPALQRLAARGLVWREAQPGDRRLQALRLSEEGEARLADIRAEVEQHETRIAAGLTDAEREQLMNLLHRVLQNRVLRG
jgi:DNA-binding MarR family transcriptional regulator